MPTNSHRPISNILKRGVRHRPGELLLELTPLRFSEIAGHWGKKQKLQACRNMNANRLEGIGKGA